MAAIANLLGNRGESLEVLLREEMDEASLFMASDADLKDMGLKKGVRVKLLNWVAGQKAAGNFGVPPVLPSAVLPEFEPPERFCCPISIFIMEDPCTLRGDGHTYERREIEAWLKRSRTSPLTGVALDGPNNEAGLEPNSDLRTEIAEWTATHR